MRQRVIPRVFTSIEESDIGYSVAKLLEPYVSEKLEEYRSLKATEKNLMDKQSKLSGNIKSIENRIQYLTQEAPSLEGWSTGLLVIGGLILIFAAAVRGGAGLLLFLLSLLMLLAGLSLKNKAKGMVREAESLKNQLDALERERKAVLEKISEARAMISSFKIQPVKIKVFQAFIPVALVRNPFGRGSMLIAPWSSPVKMRIIFVSNPSALDEAREKLSIGENLYFETVVRGRDSGYKVVEGFKRLNLWEKILSSRAPESLLAEVVKESFHLLKSGISGEEVELKIEQLDEESARSLLKLYSMADGHLPETLPVKLIEEVRGEAERLGYIASAVEQLASLRSYMEEARQLASRREVYESIVNIAVREMIAKTLPLDKEVLRFGFTNLYCKRCATALYDVYAPQIDLRKFVYDSILGGVDRDVDIVAPEPVAEEVVREGWEELEKSVNSSLPLPGVTGEEAPQEFNERYKEALRVYALPLTGADEYVELEWGSVFQPPTLRCRKCGSTLDEGTREFLWKLQLPAIKGYVALLSEKTRDLLEKSSEIITSVNSARLHKDQRKTAVGVYRQLFEDYQRELLHMTKEISEAESQLSGLRKLMAAILASEATEELLQAVAASNPTLEKQLRAVISEAARGGQYE